MPLPEYNVFVLNVSAPHNESTDTTALLRAFGCCARRRRIAGLRVACRDRACVTPNGMPSKLLAAVQDGDEVAVESLLSTESDNYTVDDVDDVSAGAC